MIASLLLGLLSHSDARPVSFHVVVSSHVGGEVEGGRKYPGLGAVARDVEARRASGQQVIWLDAGSAWGSACFLEAFRNAKPDAVAVDRETLMLRGAGELAGETLPLLGLNHFVLPAYAESPTGLLPEKTISVDGIRVQVTNLLHPDTPLWVPRDRMESLGVEAPFEAMDRALAGWRERDADFRVLMADAPWSGTNGWSLLELAEHFPDVDLIIGAEPGLREQKAKRLRGESVQWILQPELGGRRLGQLSVVIDTVTGNVLQFDYASEFLRGEPEINPCPSAAGLPNTFALLTGQDLMDVLHADSGIDVLVCPAIPALGRTAAESPRGDVVIRMLPVNDLWYELEVSQNEWAWIEQSLGFEFSVMTAGTPRSRTLRILIPGSLRAGWGGAYWGLRQRFDALKQSNKGRSATMRETFYRVWDQKKP